MAKYIVAHDVGTTNNKAVLVGVDGQVYGKVLRPYDIKYPQPGWAEQDPEDWWSAVTRDDETASLRNRNVPCGHFVRHVFNADAWHCAC